MDISDIEKKLGIEGMSAEEQMAMVVALQKSAQEKTQKARDETIGKSAELVIQGLKKIKSDIESRFSELNDTFQAKVSSLQNGKDGRDGKDGKDGLDGKQGLQGSHGKDGRDGRNGVDGADGISVTSARIDFDGSLIIGLSSGRELNAGEVVAPDLAERIKVITNGGGTSQSVLDTLTSLQNQINNLGSIPSQTGNAGKFLTTNGSVLSWGNVGGTLSYQGTWNASTNTPTLASSTGTSGYYYVVGTAGSTNLNGITDWKVGDWAIFNGSTWQKIDQTETLQTLTSNDASVTITTTNSTDDLSVYSSPRVIATVRNETGATLTKGTVVYISGASGNKPTVTKAIATGDPTSAQTYGVIFADIANNNNGSAILSGDISGLDTSAYTAGTQLYLSSTTAGGYTSTKQYAPNHLVYIGVVTRSHVNQGSIEVRIQNGYELAELHDVSAQSPSNGQTIIYNATTTLWEKANLTAGTGISVTNGAGSITLANTGVTSVSGTSPVASSGGATPAISLSSGYGDTQNPYASKTANYVLAAPNGIAGVPTFRAVVAADIPTLNQNTTGSAATLTTGRTISISGDLTYTSPSFDGSANVTAAGTLATVNTNVGSFTNASITVNGKGLITAASSGTAPVTSVTGTSPISSSGGTTPAISLASGYGDTQNPYASKTANYFLSAPNGVAGVPTFRAIVAADIPTLNQNTTGTAANITATTNSTLTTLSALSLPGSQVSGNISGNSANVTGTVAIANGGTGQTTQTAAYDALNPNTTLGDISYRNSSNNVRLAGNTTTTKKFLTQTGTGTVSAAPAWGTLVAGDVPTLNQDTTGSAGSLVTTNFSIVQSGTKLLFKYGSTTIASMDSTGVITSAVNIVANGTP
jgi:ribosomal protein L35AE/L33A